MKFKGVLILLIGLVTSTCKAQVDPIYAEFEKILEDSFYCDTLIEQIYAEQLKLKFDGRYVEKDIRTALLVDQILSNYDTTIDFLTNVTKWLDTSAIKLYNLNPYYCSLYGGYLEFHLMLYDTNRVKQQGCIIEKIVIFPDSINSRRKSTFCQASVLPIGSRKSSRLKFQFECQMESGFETCYSPYYYLLYLRFILNNPNYNQIIMFDGELLLRTHY